MRKVRKIFDLLESHQAGRHVINLNSNCISVRGDSTYYNREELEGDSRRVIRYLISLIFVKTEAGFCFFVTPYPVAQYFSHLDPSPI